MEQSAANPSDDMAQVIGRLDYEGEDAIRDSWWLRSCACRKVSSTFALDRCSFVAVADNRRHCVADRSGRHQRRASVGIDEAGVKRAVAEAWLNQDTEDDDRRQPTRRQ